MGLHGKAGAHCGGRQMVAHVSDPRANILSIPGPVGNGALQAAGVAAAVREQASAPVVLCAIGDGSTQQGEYLEACAEAERSCLPVLFVVEDNGWAISTTTAGKTFFSLGEDGRQPAEFHGIPIHYIDGRDPRAVFEQTGPIIAQMRRDRRPAIVVLKMDRLSDHTNADDQTTYRTPEDIQRSAQTGDPIVIFEEHLLATGVAQEQLDEIKQQLKEEVIATEASVFDSPEPTPILTAKPQVAAELTDRGRERGGGNSGGPAMTMRDAMRETLRHHLGRDERVVMFGQDIEDPKGDVFGVTKGLSTQFAGRVMNAPLTESTIIGASIGRALTGQRPVAFLQFADFLPLAFNQLSLDLASMWWRTDGGWTSPVIVLAPCGGYRAGLGPFHSHSLEALLAHTPGLDVFMPSTAADAAGMLNAAFASERPTIFLYPKACLNDPEQATTGDVSQHFVPIGKARKERAGHDITLVGWGNTVRLCRRAADELAEANVEAEVIDLRSISPWDEQMVLASAQKTGRLVVVHEDAHSCGVGAEIMATVAEKASTAVAMRRVARPDTFVPCNFGNQIEVLPSLKRVTEAAAELLDLDVSWKLPEQAPLGQVFSLEAVGTGPSDEAVEIVELFVKAGDRVNSGDAVAELEATKGTFELTSPVTGTIEEILAGEGDSMPVGDVMMRILTDAANTRRKPITKEICGKPEFAPRGSGNRETSGRPALNGRTLTSSATISATPRRYDVGMAGVKTVTGSRIVTNAELLPPGAEMTPEDIFRRTGIESRCWVGDGENALDDGQPRRDRFA